MKNIKKMNKFILSVMVLNISLGACEFTITNDTDYKKIYVSLNPNLADVVSENTLKDPSSFAQSEDKTVLKNFSIVKGAKGKTQFTKQFDIFVPLKANGQYKRQYRIHMKYCKDAQFNSMTVSQIKRSKPGAHEPESIDMKRFDVVDFNFDHQASQAHTLLTPHAVGFEHEHEYHERKNRAQPEQNTQLNQATEQEIERPGHLLENPNVYKELLP